MKAFPVYEALKNDFCLTMIHTGQHYDEKMSKVFFEQLKFPRPDISLNLEKNTKAGDFDDKLYIKNDEYLINKDRVIDDLINFKGDLGQLGEIRDKLKIEFEKLKPDLVVVFGDVTSTLAAGLACKILNIDIAHVESGLRSGDIKMPEEVNRILTDHITKYYFITEQSGIDNLKKEGKNENLYLVGNTMIDTQNKYLQQALDTKYYEQLNVKPKEYILITLHRPSNVDNMDKLKEIFDDLFELSKKEVLVYPIHPRTKNNLYKLGYLDKLNENKNIILCDPLGYLEMTCLLSNCKYIITDSGGLQEESTSLNIPCFTLRENTERPCTLIENNGTNQLINKISNIVLKECKGNMVLWDGKSSIKILHLLRKKSLRVAVGYAHSGKNIGGVRRYIENIEKLSTCKVTLYPSYENDIEWRKEYDMKVRNDYRNNEIIAKQQEIIDNNDVFHSNVDPTWIKLCYEAQKQGKLWIHTYHNIYMKEDEPNGILKEWQKEINDIQFNVASNADYKLCVGEWLVSEFNNKNINSTYLPNFIDIDKLYNVKKGEFIKKYNINNFILFSGDNSIRKNCIEFIKTAKLLPEYKFVLIGTGLLKDEIIKIYNITIPNNVILLGPLEHIECLEAMIDCSILIMNSFTEGLPTVLIEGLYFEKPCIIPDGPKWSKYLLQDKKLGYKYELGNIEQLSNIIKEIMKEYKDMPMAKKYVEEIFSSNIIINKLDQIYEQKNSYGYYFKRIKLNEFELDKNIHYNYNGLDFLYKNNRHNKNLFIVFHGSVKLNINKPVFYCHQLDQFNNNYDILSFADPLLEKYKNLELSWFLSSESVDTLNLIKEIINNIKLKYKNILCHGTSGGGFPALIISSYFKFNCLIGNSQIYLIKYWNYSFMKTTVKGLIEIDIERYLLDNQLPNKLFIFQNINDEEHYLNHYSVFKNFLITNFNCDNVFFYEFTREDIGTPIPYYPEVEQYKPDIGKYEDEIKYNYYYNFRRDILGKNHNAPFPLSCDKYKLFSSILDEENIQICDKKKMLISSLDNKFFIEIVELLQKDFDVKIDIYHENKENVRNELLNWADIIFCEWCENNALWYSKNKKPHQKLFIRLHKYELFAQPFYDINWNNVNNIIFIAPEMKRLANKHILQMKYINENNFDWEYYLNNNTDLFEDLSKNNYNKIWAWNHWVNVGIKIPWKKPFINLLGDIDYDETCNEFKNFNGGKMIFNYVKTDMFKNLQKIEGSEFNIGMIGILPKIKRPDIAVQIIKKLIIKDKRYKLYILGKWYTEWNGTSKEKKEIEYYKKLEEIIKSEELKDNIIIESFTSEPHIWLQKIGYLLSVSDIEGSHQAVAESMATGTIPFIYGKALKEYKLDEVYPKKYCFYEDNIDVLCNKIQYYSNNKECRYVESGDCKKFSNDNFWLNNIYNQILKVLKD